MKPQPKRKTKTTQRRRGFNAHLFGGFANEPQARRETKTTHGAAVSTLICFEAPAASCTANGSKNAQEIRHLEVDYSAQADGRPRTAPEGCELLQRNGWRSAWRSSRPRSRRCLPIGWVWLLADMRRAAIGGTFQTSGRVRWLTCPKVAHSASPTPPTE